MKQEKKGKVCEYYTCSWMNIGIALTVASVIFGLGYIYDSYVSAQAVDCDFTLEYGLENDGARCWIPTIASEDCPKITHAKCSFNSQAWDDVLYLMEHS